MKNVNIPKIGIIGRGFVGGALEKYLTEKGITVHSYDVMDDADPETVYKDIVEKCPLIYICVPTPMAPDGSCDIKRVTSVCSRIDEAAKLQNKAAVVLIKSTMAPGTTDFLQGLFNNLIIAANPEFLTERRAYEDLKNADCHVVGIPNGETNPLALLLVVFFSAAWPLSTVVFVEPIEAELIKYMTNNFFAVKVSFANQIYQLCQAIGVDYTTFVNSAIKIDPRLGDQHWDVPGHDGKLGFGGKCFPKDLRGMISVCGHHGVDCSLLETAWNYNLRVRPDAEWSEDVGSSIIVTSSLLQESNLEWIGRYASDAESKSAFSNGFSGTHPHITGVAMWEENLK